MRKSRLSQYKQDRLIEHFIADTTARCAAELIQVNKNTSTYYFHRLRVIIYEYQKQFEDELFDGKIEVDESYFGGGITAAFVKEKEVKEHQEKHQYLVC